MSDDELRRDAEIARALEGIRVPGYELGFWERLEARVAHEGGRAEGVPADVVPLEDAEVVALPTVVPLPSERREQRRSLAVLAVAAAAILAILVVRLSTDQPDELRVAGGTGGLQVAPDDGTTTPDVGPEQDGARRPGDDDGPAADDGASGEAGETTGASPDVRATPTSAVGGGGESTTTGPAAATALLAPTTAEATFVAWASAIDRGDVDGAAALTGPRTIRYFEALGADIDDVLTESQEGWGAWADADGRRIRSVELGQVDGERAVGLVLDRPDPASDDTDVRVRDGVPVVKGPDGWRVEFAAFDPAKEDQRIEMISPAPGTDGQDLPKGEIIRVAAQRSGEYYLNLDDPIGGAQSTRIRATDAVDGEITWNPSGLKNRTEHLLVVAHLDKGQVVLLVQTFQTR